MQVSFNPETAKVYRLKDTPCPESSIGGSKCQTVIGSFDIYVSGMLEKEQSMLYSKYLNATQKAIDDGDLQEALDSVDDRSVFVVERAATPPPMALDGSSLVMQQQLEAANTGNSKDDVGMMGVVFIIGASGIVLGVGIAAFQLFQNKRSKVKPPHDKHLDVTEAITGHGEEDHLGVPPVALMLDESYRSQVEGLLKQNCPEQSDNVDTLLMQFKGREDQLIVTLQNLSDPEEEMEEGSAKMPQIIADEDSENSIMSALSRTQPHHCIAALLLDNELEEAAVVEEEEKEEKATLKHESFLLLEEGCASAKDGAPASSSVSANGSTPVLLEKGANSEFEGCTPNEFPTTDNPSAEEEGVNHLNGTHHADGNTNNLAGSASNGLPTTSDPPTEELDDDCPNNVADDNQDDNDSESDFSTSNDSESNFSTSDNSEASSHLEMDLLSLHSIHTEGDD